MKKKKLIKKLKSKIDKMKSCVNCSHGFYHNKELRCDVDDYYCIQNGKYTLWKLMK